MRPDLLHGDGVLAHEVPPLGRLDAVVAHLLFQPARGNTEKEPATGDVVDGGHLFRRDDGISLRDHTHRCAELQSRRTRRPRSWARPAPMNGVVEYVAS